MSQDPGFDLYQKGLSLRKTRWKEAVSAVWELIFSASGALVLVAVSGWKNKLLGLLCLLFFGVILTRRVRNLIAKTPVVLLSPEGVSDLRWSHGTIPWTAVSRAWAVTIAGERMVWLELHQPELYPEQRTKNQDEGDLRISVSGLDHGPEKVVAYANAYIAQAAADAPESKPAG